MFKDEPFKKKRKKEELGEMFYNVLFTQLKKSHKNEVQENSTKLWTWKQWEKIAFMCEEGIWHYNGHAEEVPFRFS